MNDPFQPLVLSPSGMKSLLTAGLETSLSGVSQGRTAVETKERAVGGRTPHKTAKTVMEGSREFSSDVPVFLVTRAPDKKHCACCNRGTHLLFSYNAEWALSWRKCRRCLTPDEAAALWIMLTEAEAGGLTDA